ncbi:MAG TPA: aminoacyl-tRNA hydrolase [Bacteroidia bacterium]|jgi:PTH1 family peptidyl-tRNA hydrolase|uniref:aminoacyl-tRNA hydrolase n=1 Tax=Candidatus Pollutiaquabacter sp. TaxID=3416354 RepID=UPI002BCC3D42|nr:aminoacyl-tRNA hydrolase [Bacteroidota bacterium]HPD53472.1 aminoacyl-tRNA hydrolase [Bacteroidia bacterium]HRS38686.1 aminoacyl-tRNA hydrolase [Bacteroidia bacterium]
MSKFLIAGLGNIGEEYTRTRHNIGFLVAERLAADLNKDETGGKLFSTDRLVTIHHTRFKGKGVVVIKPTTFMNLSGKAVQYWLQAEKIPVNHLLVVTDDLALPYGTLRMKKSGGAGGHNGLTDIIDTLQTENFPRLRFGIGSEFQRGKQVDYVLGEWSEDEQKILNERIDQAVLMIKSFIGIGIDRTMSDFNNK